MKIAKSLAVASILAASAGVSFADEAKPLFIYVSPNPIGVNDFLKLGKLGAEDAAKALGGQAKTYESTDPTTRKQNLEAAAKAGAKVVVAIGFEFNDMLPDVATAYPSVKFLQIDSCPFDKLKPNIYCSVFREYEANFLAGAEAALTSRTGKIGAVGALDIPFLHRYTDAFIAGAKQVKPDVQVSPTLWSEAPTRSPIRRADRSARRRCSPTAPTASWPPGRGQTAGFSKRFRIRRALALSASTSINVLKRPAL
jgi:basic membrane protein A and related proteins